MSLIKRLVAYQRERFPLKVLVFTTLSSTLASVAVTGGAAGFQEMAAVFLCALFTVFHVRVIDESRDAAHDGKYFPNRPVQRGMVSLRELFLVDIVGLAVIVGVAIAYGLPALIWAVGILLFTSLAWKDFFMHRFFYNKPLLYHIVNSPQMVMLQLFIFAVLTGSFAISHNMWLQLILVYMLIFVIEVVRKIEVVGHETGSGDQYSNTIGFKGALYFTLVLSLLAYIVFMVLLINLSQSWILYLSIGTAIIHLMGLSIVRHMLKKSKKTEKLLLLSSVLLYVGFNVLVFLSTI